MEIGKILRLEPQQINPEEPLGSYGLDSLMAVELALPIEAQLDIDIRALELTSGSLRSLASRLIERLASKVPRPPDRTVPPALDDERR
jgi:acyl carrier protein